MVLHGMHHRQVRPWELFVDTEADQARFAAKLDSLGGDNSYEDEPWAVRYDERNIIRKVFDREIWIKEPALRQIQDIIFAQSLALALLLAGALSAIFVSVPGGNFF